MAVGAAGRVEDDELRWLYGSCLGLIAASYEDFGLTPVEAAAFAKPMAALRWGGFLDSIVEGQTGCYFDAPTTEAIAEAVRTLAVESWSAEHLTEHADRYSPERFLSRISEVVDEVRPLH